MQTTFPANSATDNGLTVLVADDDAQVRMAVRTRLVSWGYRVIECADGLGAIAKTNGLRVDAIILDHEMPLGKGQSIVECLRRDTDVPVIFLSGLPGEEFRETIMRVPDTYYLSKPLDQLRLRELLESLLPAGACA